MNTEYAASCLFKVCEHLTSPVTLKHSWMVRRVFTQPEVGVMLDYVWKQSAMSNRTHVATMTLLVVDHVEKDTNSFSVTRPALKHRFETCDMGTETDNAFNELIRTLGTFAPKLGLIYIKGGR
jgi:hypothetical protein